MSSRSSPPRERLASSGSVLSDDSEMMEGLDDVDFEVSDPRLRKAVDKAGKEKNIMPLIKEELRLSILTRRNKEGKGDIVIEEKKHQVKRILTPQEKERKLRRQEQNRRAAKKCRKKKKDCEVTIMKAYNSEKDKNHNLCVEVEELKREKEKLEEFWREHISKCSLIQNQSTFVPIPDIAHLQPCNAPISPFDTGMSSATEPDTPNPTTPHTPGQTFSFSPLPFSSYTDNEEIYTGEKDECPTHTDFSGFTQPNLDDCFGSELENIDITPFASFNNSPDTSQYLGTGQLNFEAALPSNPQESNNLTSDGSATTLSGLEAFIDFLHGQTGVDANEDITTETECTIASSQACEITSCTEFHDTI